MPLIPPNKNNNKDLGILNETQLKICKELAAGPTELANLSVKLQMTPSALKEDLAVINATAMGPLTTKGREVSFARDAEFLRADKILSFLSSLPSLSSLCDAAGAVNPARQRLSSNSLRNSLRVLASADSGNECVRRLPQRPAALFCEQQTKGRGRYGRVWHSPFGAGLSLSAVFDLEDFRQSGTHGLSLAVGVMMMRFVGKLGLSARLKWPNDLMDPSGNKIGGILLEVFEKDIVIGVGINHHSQTAFGSSLCRMAKIAGTKPPRRNRAAALMLDALFTGIRQFTGIGQFTDNGFAVFADEWRAADHLRGKTIVVRNGKELAGICKGINRRGELLLTDAAGKEHRILAGTLQEPGADEPADAAE